jgi:hypothetical protein
MDELDFSGSFGAETDNAMEDTAFDYIPSGDSPYDTGPVTETASPPYSLDYNGPPTEDPMTGPGYDQTTYGANPWGTGAGGGYRPMSQARTDDAPLGSAEAQRLAGSRRMAAQQPSNAAIDPETIYDRQSYEYESGNVIGAGIFDMPEGVTWNANDGVFANHYALPEYIAREPSMYPAQSQMIDSQTGLPTVVQPSAGGVQLAMEAPPGTQVYSPFTQMGPQTNRTPVPRVPYSQTPRGMSGVPAANGAVESFGQEAAVALIRRAAMMKAPQREQFIARAMQVLGPERARAAGAAIGRLMNMGYPSSHVVEQVFAHGVMHAVASEMAHVARTGTPVPPQQSVVRAATAAAAEVGTQQQLARAAQRVVPALTNAQAARGELSAFGAAPVRQQVIASLGSDGMGGFGADEGGMSTGAKVAVGVGVVAALGAAWVYRDKLFGKK